MCWHGVELGLANQFNPVPGVGRVDGRKDSVVARRSGTRKPAFYQILKATRVPGFFPHTFFSPYAAITSTIAVTYSVREIPK
jgi:hypothetical protein